jgi:repressor LexA
MPELSDSQQALLDFLRQYIDEQGYPPSYREMAAALGFKSTNGVAYQLRCLEDKGLLERKTSGAPARALRLTARALPAPANSSEHLIQVPVLGQVAAGLPALSEAMPDEVLSLDRALCPGGEVFALRVRGDSMVDAGIYEDDLVFVQRRVDAHDGEVVVAVIDGEATVKTLRRRGGMVVLEPANARMQPIRIAPSQQLQLAGVVVGLYRQIG